MDGHAFCAYGFCSIGLIGHCNESTAITATGATIKLPRTPLRWDKYALSRETVMEMARKCAIGWLKSEKLDEITYHTCPVLRNYNMRRHQHIPYFFFCNLEDLEDRHLLAVAISSRGTSSR